MANRYWVGGTDTWDNTAGTKWATTSGGAGGAAVPTSSDDVFFDANSGAVTVVIGYYQNVCLNLDFTNFTGTISHTSTLNVSGDVTLGSGMTFTGTGASLVFNGLTGTLTTNGVAMTYSSYLGGPYFKDDGVSYTSATAVYNLIGNLNLGAGSFSILKGTVNTNNYTIECHAVNMDNKFYVSQLNLGSSLIILNGTGSSSRVWYYYGIYHSLDAGTSTIKITATKEVTLSHYDQSLTFYNIWNATSGAGILKIQGNTTLNIGGYLKCDPGTTTKFGPGMTYSVAEFQLLGTSGNDITLESGTAGSTYTLSQATGIIDTDYLNVKDSIVTGGAIWYWGTNNNDSGNNTGWHYRWTNPTNAYASDDTYATAAATSGVLDVYLSKDGGLNWQLVRQKTYDGTEGSQTYGDGATELWGSSWTGDDVDDTSFRLRIQHGQYVEIYKDFGSTVPSTNYLNGIKVDIEAKYTASTFSVDYIAVTFYHSNTTLAVQAGSVAFASDGRKNGEGAGSGTGVQVFHDGSDWIAVDSGAPVAA